MPTLGRKGAEGERVAFNLRLKEKHLESRERQGYGLQVPQMLMLIEYWVIPSMREREGVPY